MSPRNLRKSKNNFRTTKSSIYTQLGSSRIPTGKCRTNGSRNIRKCKINSKNNTKQIRQTQKSTSNLKLSSYCHKSRICAVNPRKNLSLSPSFSSTTASSKYYHWRSINWRRCLLKKSTNIINTRKYNKLISNLGRK